MKQNPSCVKLADEQLRDETIQTKLNSCNIETKLNNCNIETKLDSCNIQTKLDSSNIETKLDSCNRTIGWKACPASRVYINPFSGGSSELLTRLTQLLSTQLSAKLPSRGPPCCHEIFSRRPNMGWYIPSRRDWESLPSNCPTPRLGEAELQPKNTARCIPANTSAWCAAASCVTMRMKKLLCQRPTINLGREFSTAPPLPLPKVAEYL